MTAVTDPGSETQERTTSTELAVSDLTVRVGGRVLLENASACFEAGEVTLIIGCSGAGKSVLLRVLAGLADRDDSPIRVDGQCLFRRGAELLDRDDCRVGVVFQHFALFDELSPLDNVRLAVSHRGRAGNHDPQPAELLDELSVPTQVRTSALSGGQKQRLAIARTLAQRPDVILYDEPTSGLDSATAHRVAQLIGRTHESHPVTSIIVTHDYESLPPIADRVVLFDAESRSLQLLDDVSGERLRELLDSQVSPDDDTTARLPNALQSSAGAAGKFFETTTRSVLAALKLPLSILPLWKSPAWGMRYMLHYLNLVGGLSAWAYIAIAGMIAGFVTTYFTFKFLPYRSYTEPLLIEDLLHSMGFALYRILVPILVTILVAARSGAAVASDIGGKAYGHQLDALRTIGARPERYLLTGSLWAFLIGTPVLLAIGYSVAAATSLVVFSATHPDRGPVFWDLHFHRELRVAGQLLFDGTHWLISKTLVSAAGIALIAYHQAAGPKRSNRDVSTAITSAILWSTLFVLIVQFAWSFFEFE